MADFAPAIELPLESVAYGAWQESVSDAVAAARQLVAQVA